MSHLPFDVDYLTENLKQKARIELEETEENRENALKEMRTCLKEETGLYCLTTDKFLLLFLRAKKFSVKNAMAAMLNSYRLKMTYNDAFAARDFQGIINVCQDRFFSIMPYRDIDGTAVVLMKLGHWNYNNTSFTDLFHYIAMILIICVYHHPATQVCGIKVIVDGKGLTWSHMFRMSPRMLHIATQSTSAASVRLKGLHFINESAVIRYGWNIMKFALPEKLKKRVHFHSTNFDSLTAKINPALLPEDIGGTMKNDNSAWVSFMKTQEDNYYELCSHGYRSGKQLL